MGGRSVASRIARRDLPPPQGSTGADNGGRKAFHEKPPPVLIPVSAKGLAGTRQCQRAHPRTYAAIIRRRASERASPTFFRPLLVVAGEEDDRIRPALSLHV
ncbi:hypothetical protein ZWY2020_034998 [Hordeum vulgare]|nr:hypothetical protein ZWY2020_034998 [Hordeum vulgare]